MYVLSCNYGTAVFRLEAWVLVTRVRFVVCHKYFSKSYFFCATEQEFCVLYVYTSITSVCMLTSTCT